VQGQDPAVSLPDPPPVRWGRLIAIILTVVAVPASIIEYREHQRFVAFTEARAAWHRTCDAYQHTPLTDPVARQCDDELQRLTALAKREGWTP
jgi:hypothetical protein